jgi:ribosomal protein S18 acetylase RimI-like enzyme
MIRPTIPADTPLLVAMTEKTRVFKPLEIAALQEVLDDFHAGTAGEDHRCITFEQSGQAIGFAYFAPVEMTDRSWHLWWIVVDPEIHTRGIGSQLMRRVEEDVLAANGRVLFVETSGLPHYEPTRRFYIKLHYEQEAKMRDFYAEGDDMIVFRKLIKA